MGPLCFDYGFGPFRWVCCSNDPADLEKTDRIAAETLGEDTGEFASGDKTANVR